MRLTVAYPIGSQEDKARVSLITNNWVVSLGQLFLRRERGKNSKYLFNCSQKLSRLPNTSYKSPKNIKIPQCKNPGFAKSMDFSDSTNTFP